MYLCKNEKKSRWGTDKNENQLKEGGSAATFVTTDPFPTDPIPTDPSPTEPFFPDPSPPHLARPVPADPSSPDLSPPNPSPSNPSPPNPSPLVPSPTESTDPSPPDPARPVPARDQRSITYISGRSKPNQQGQHLSENKIWFALPPPIENTCTFPCFDCF
jgi:hypothetical protein